MIDSTKNSDKRFTREEVVHVLSKLFKEKEKTQYRKTPLMRFLNKESELAFAKLFQEELKKIYSKLPFINNH